MMLVLLIVLAAWRLWRYMGDQKRLQWERYTVIGGDVHILDSHHGWTICGRRQYSVALNPEQALAVLGLRNWRRCPSCFSPGNDLLREQCAKEREMDTITKLLMELGE